MAKRKAPDPEPLSPIGKRIQELIDARGIGDNEFAASVGWKGGYFSKFKRQEDPSGLRVLAVARKLGVDFVWLLTGEHAGGGARQAFLAALTDPDEGALAALLILNAPDPDTDVEWWANRYQQLRNVRSFAAAQEAVDAKKLKQRAPAAKAGQRKSEPHG